MHSSNSFHLLAASYNTQSNGTRRLNDTPLYIAICILHLQFKTFELFTDTHIMCCVVV